MAFGGEKKKLLLACCLMKRGEEERGARAGPPGLLGGHQGPEEDKKEKRAFACDEMMHEPETAGCKNTSSTSRGGSAGDLSLLEPPGGEMDHY